MPDTEITHFNRARQELALATNIDELKDIRDKSEALRAYTKQAGHGLEAQNKCAEITIRAERRVGELLIETPPKHTGRPGKNKCADNTNLSLDDIGLSGHQSADWQKIAKIPEEVFEAHIEDTKASGAELTTKDTVRLTEKPHVAHSSGENEWYTPPELIESVRAVMGDIDCDPASSKIANNTIQAKQFYTIADDGLSCEWAGRVFLNPPYAQPLVAQFAKAIAYKYETNETIEACVLVNNATETAWFRRILSQASAVCFIQGRVKFLDQQGQRSGCPLQGQAVLYLGSKQKLFAEIFTKHGAVLCHA